VQLVVDISSAERGGGGGQGGGHRQQQQEQQEQQEQQAYARLVHAANTGFHQLLRQAPAHWAMGEVAGNKCSCCAVICVIIVIFDAMRCDVVCCHVMSCDMMSYHVMCCDVL
jgi:hypothetical protein